ncbi:CBS domain-containing protein [bacterium]|nr:CBS domain-containing protein [bacterium]MBU1615465.1 CBS domain-containing protein [bacterium]
MTKKPIREILTEDVISVSPKTPLLEAILIMDSKKISCLVVTEDRKPVGIFTERDVVLAANRKDYFDSLKIEELMAKPVITAQSDVDIYEAYNLLAANRMRHLVIVDANGELAGVVTQFDIKNALELEYFVELKSTSKIMTKNVITVEKDCLVCEAVSKMAGHLISCLIVSEDEYPLGILTERDVVRLFREGADIKALRVGQVMSHPVLSMSAGAPVYEAVGIMNKKGIRRLVVVDKDGKLSGLVTQSDITNGLIWKYIESLKETVQGKDRMIAEQKQMEKELAKHREHLEQLVEEQTAELKEKIADLEKFTDIAVSRELKMAELEETVNSLRKELNRFKESVSTP